MHGLGYVPCNISDRYLQFDDTYHEETGLVFATVMTGANSESPKKLCSLCLNIHDLQEELSNIKPE